MIKTMTVKSEIPTRTQIVENAVLIESNVKNYGRNSALNLKENCSIKRIIFYSPVLWQLGTIQHVFWLEIFKNTAIFLNSTSAAI